MKAAPNSNPGRESTDASPKVIGVVAASLAAGIAAALLAAHAIFFSGPVSRAPAPGLGDRALFQNGAAQRTSIERDWARIDAETARNLHTYGWIDRGHGVARIPIERAMDLVAEGRR